ncbi:AraC family transcriptional regulator ligand-binding domain-containing protein [Aquiflexum sp.]|uniref:AraC family transcriptional regulator ligand-binding domain-containing protein n=1 Tax=Aquiflexum sp. TaxID=1872584 RepID=UPI00359376DD
MIAAVHLSYIREYLTDRNIYPDGYFADKGVPIGSFPNEGRIHNQTFLQLFTGLSQFLSDPYFGLHYGAYLNVKALGFVTHVAQHAGTINQAVRILKEYLAHSFSIVKIIEVKQLDKYEISLDVDPIGTEEGKHLLDAIFAFVFRELKLITPEQYFPELVLPYNDLEHYELILNTTCRTGIRLGFVFDPEILNQPIHSGMTTGIEYLLPKLLLMLDEQKAVRPTFGQQFRTICLKLSCPEPPNFEQAAAYFPMSQRTIQRKLNAEGLSYRKISDSIRRELSVYLSANPRMKTQDIAYLLGYGDASAYLHAAQRWIQSPDPVA